MLHRVKDRLRRRSTAQPDGPTVLILTPVKNAKRFLPTYFRLLSSLSYPTHLISIGFLEGDSNDGTYEALSRAVPILRKELRRVGLWKHDFGLRYPNELPRHLEEIQYDRRSVLAMSRNHLLFRALDDEDWVLWLDVDLVQYPRDLIERLLATDRDIVHPNCVLRPRGPSYDLNAWRDHGRLHLEDLRKEGDLVPLDTVGGTCLLVRADVHRSGVIFPAFPFGRLNPKARPDTPELETEGFGLMAEEAGYRCWGMPNFEIIHLKL